MNRIEFPKEERTPFVVDLTAREREVVVELAKKMDVPEQKVMIMALRLYQSHVNPVPMKPLLTPEQLEWVRIRLGGKPGEVEPQRPWLAGMNMLSDEDFEEMQREREAAKRPSSGDVD